MSAIVLDGHLKSALVCVRSLGRAGILVSVGAERKTAPALHSRYATARFVYPSPYTDREGFVRHVKAEAVRLGGKPVVYALSDATYLALYENRDDLERYMTLVYPEPKSVEIAFDKAATYSLARVSHVPTIPTHVFETRAEVERLSRTFSYPAVVKARHSVTQNAGVGIFGSASFVHTPTELVAKWESLREQLGEAPLIQEFVRGEEYGVEMLVREGEPYAVIIHHRIRSLSPTGGASVVKETVREGAVRQMLEAYALVLVRALSWSGPFMAEFKIDSDSREPKLMEINGRFWGSLPLGVAAGVDVPFLYYKDALGTHTRGELLRAREGIVSRYFLGDCRHLLRVLFARDPMRSILYPKRLQALKDFWNVPKGTVGDVWNRKDWKPSIMEIIDMMKRLWN